MTVILRRPAVKGKRVFEWFLVFARVALALPRIELRRKIEGPAPLLDRLRAEGLQCRPRTEAQRAILRQLILSVDARMPGGANCYRRVLLEVALDAAAASAPFSMGLDAGCAPLSGHAWLGIGDLGGRSYDAVITL
jgi:hypothetical protein